MKHPQQQFHEVTDFLTKINLEKYTAKFIENGIEDLETILELSDTHLGALGVPLGHKLKILKQIKVSRLESGMSEPKWRGRPESQASHVESNVRPYSSHDYSELPEPE